jgi:hypothetical protein
MPEPSQSFRPKMFLKKSEKIFWEPDDFGIEGWW